MATQSDPIVDLGYAKYRGRRISDQSTVYLGLPYAQPPIGSLRFRRPQPLIESAVHNAADVTDATQYPSFAIQGATGPHDVILYACDRSPESLVKGYPQALGGAGSEDCLKVDIYAPASASPSDSYPVLAYIHV